MTTPTTGGQPTPPKNELAVRIVTAVVLATASFYALWSGLYPFVGLVFCFTLLGAYEFNRFGELKGFRPGKRVLVSVCLALNLVSAFGDEAALSRTLVLGFLFAFVVMLLRPGRRVSVLADTAMTALGIVYVGWFFSFLILLRKLPEGAALITLLIIGTTFTDMGGYFIGKAFGRRKLYERVSPKKTVEGALGGMFTAIIGCTIIGSYLGLPILHCPVVAIIVAVVGQFGDLFESCLKRDVGVKDSGQAIIGHGGALDRFDSLAFAAPIFYLYSITFIL